MRDTTQQVLIVAEAMHATAADDMALLLEVLATAATGLGCTVAARALLSRASPRLAWDRPCATC